MKRIIIIIIYLNENIKLFIVDLKKNIYIINIY